LDGLDGSKFEREEKCLFNEVQVAGGGDDFFFLHLQQQLMIKQFGLLTILNSPGCGCCLDKRRGQQH
jgi:hypothetical protein